MKKIIFAILCVGLFAVFSGCSAEKISAKKLKDVEFTVVNKREIPEELKKMIDEKGTMPFKLTFTDEMVYILQWDMVKQPTSGYSIEVNELYETKNAIYIRTNLIGPAKEEKIMEVKTYPYVVTKMEVIDKSVVFE